MKVNKYVLAIGGALVGSAATLLVKKLRDESQTSENFKNATSDLYKATKDLAEAAVETTKSISTTTEAVEAPKPPKTVSRPITVTNKPPAA